MSPASLGIELMGRIARHHPRFRGPLIGSAALLATLTPALALAGCGDSQSEEEEKIDAVVKSYLVAFVGGDGAAACELLSEEARLRLAELTAASGGPEVAGLGCERIVDQIGAALDARGEGEEARARAEQIEVTGIEIDGDAASVELHGEGIGGPIAERSARLEKEGDAWRISSLETGQSP